MKAVKRTLTRNARLEQDIVIQEVTRSYELARKLEPFLPLLPLGKPQSELAEGLFREVLQALTKALSILKSSESPLCFSDSVNAGASSMSLSDQGSEVSDVVKTPRRGCRKRTRREEVTSVNSWTEVTNAPFDDGYQWRKYGQKNIQKARLSRSYYRCSYKEQGCQATKQIEEKGSSDQPLFLVTYYEEHTCQTNPNAAYIELDPAIKKPCLLNFESNITNMYNQQNTLLSFHTSDQQGCELETANKQEEVVCSSNSSEALVGTAMIEPVKVEGEHLEAVAHNEMEDMLTSACLSPSWKLMAMDYLMMDSPLGFEGVEELFNF